jgi:hypothetical protein
MPRALATAVVASTEVSAMMVMAMTKVAELDAIAHTELAFARIVVARTGGATPPKLNLLASLECVADDVGHGVDDCRLVRRHPTILDAG